MQLSLEHPKYELGKSQYDFYHKNGYIVIDNLFSNVECDRIYDLFCDHADADFSAILNLDREVKELQLVMKMPKVVSIIEALFDSEAYGLMTQMLFKQVGSSYANQSWTVHQDNAYHQNQNGATLTINISCKDSDVQTGTLYVFPGTHKEGIMPFKPKESFREKKGASPGNTLILPNKYQDKKTDVIMKKGDMLILHGNCAHGSYPNISTTRSRPLYSITYIKKGESFVVGKNANRKEFALC
jgi:ectoine hydroxylase-related dioxygenase (phytanoyl-CoA dioxygenase family)